MASLLAKRARVQHGRDVKRGIVEEALAGARRSSKKELRALGAQAVEAVARNGKMVEIRPPSKPK